MASNVVNGVDGDILDVTSQASFAQCNTTEIAEGLFTPPRGVTYRTVRAMNDKDS